jgi:hypothetical protein
MSESDKTKLFSRLQNVLGAKVVVRFKVGSPKCFSECSLEYWVHSVEVFADNSAVLKLLCRDSEQQSCQSSQSSQSHDDATNAAEISGYFAPDAEHLDFATDMAGAPTITVPLGALKKHAGKTFYELVLS